jgi:copper chaperone CopZ
MAGPATNAATITMIGKILGRKSLFAYLGAIISGALLSGLFIDTFLPEEWFQLSEHYGHMSHNHELLPAWLKTGSAITLGLLILNGYIRKYFFRTAPVQSIAGESSGSSKTVTIWVGGMTCNHCRENVENSISSVGGVESVSVDLASGKVEIQGKEIDLKKVTGAIQAIGYTVKNKDS